MCGSFAFIHSLTLQKCCVGYIEYTMKLYIVIVGDIVRRYYLKAPC